MDAACCEYPLSWHNSDCLGWHKTNTPHHLLIKSTYGIGVQNKTTTPSPHHLTDHLTSSPHRPPHRPSSTEPPNATMKNNLHTSPPSNLHSKFHQAIHTKQIAGVLREERGKKKHPSIGRSYGLFFGKECFGGFCISWC